MFENSTVPFTIVKETNEKGNSNQHNQYTWKKTLLSPDKLELTIENIILVQEPTETLSLSAVLVQSKCIVGSQINCQKCGVKSVDGLANRFACPFCQQYYVTVETKHDCSYSEKNFITCSSNIIFHNYLHEFTNNYSYEVMCKIPSEEKPSECSFSRTEIRSNKAIAFKKCYGSTCGEKFDMSNLDLYFCIRRLDNQNMEMTTNTMLSVNKIFQNSDIKDGKVILQTKDGPVTAHKSVLSHYSDVFRAMLAHEMKEKQEGVVKISDFHCKIIQKMVDYLYTGKLGNITEMVYDLFKLAHHYQLHELRRRCEEYYMFNFDINNDHIVEILELADLYDLEDLKNNAEKFVKRYEKDMSKLSSYQKYLCQSITIKKAVKTLIFADQYAIIDVKNCALDFIKLNYKKMGESLDFLILFELNPRLMKEIYVYFYEQKD